MKEKSKGRPIQKSAERISERYPLFLALFFLVIWVLLAISPSHRDVWLAENFLTILFFAILVGTYNYFRFSNFTYTLIFLFLVLHSLGGHYSYSEVPLFSSLRDSLDLGRNHYDRLVHFLFGVVFMFPCYEFLKRKLNLSRGKALILAFLVVSALKGIFEVLEWGYHLVWESRTYTENYLGMQGDVWDAQKDMLLGFMGSAVSWLVLWLKEK